MRLTLLAILLLLPLAAPAATFKCVDENGKTQYSDKPCPGGKEIKLPELSTFDAPQVPQQSRRDASKGGDEGEGESDAAATDYTVDIISPQHEASFYSNDGAVSVSVSVNPRLAEGHQLMLYVGGQPSADSPLAGGTASLSGLERGTHALRAAVLDASGQQLASSSTIQIHISQQSVLRPRKN